MVGVIFYQVINHIRSLFSVINHINNKCLFLFIFFNSFFKYFGLLVDERNMYNVQVVSYHNVITENIKPEIPCSIMEVISGSVKIY